MVPVSETPASLACAAECEVPSLFASSSSDAMPSDDPGPMAKRAWVTGRPGISAVAAMGVFRGLMGRDGGCGFGVAPGSETARSPSAPGPALGSALRSVEGTTLGGVAFVDLDG